MDTCEFHWINRPTIWNGMIDSFREIFIQKQTINLTRWERSQWISTAYKKNYDENSSYWQLMHMRYIQQLTINCQLCSSSALLSFSSSSSFSSFCSFFIWNYRGISRLNVQNGSIFFHVHSFVRSFICLFVAFSSSITIPM